MAQVKICGLTRPELAVLLSSAKLVLQRALEQSEVPDDPALGEDLLDRVEIGRVGGQVEQLCTRRADRLTDGGGLVAAEVVHHDDIASPQVRDQQQSTVCPITLP